MTVSRTFSIIKPDATRRNLTGAIVKMFEDGGLRIVASKRIQMTRAQAEGFYGVHKERPFFGELVDFMISEPVVVQVLEGENAVTRTGTSWAPLTQKTLTKAQSVNPTLCPSAKIPFTVPIAQKMLPSKSLYFFNEDELVG